MDAKNNANICPHNEGVECDTPNCERCGWYPPVSEKRKAEMIGPEKRYKITFTGYCEVWAKTPEEATEKAETVEQQFFAHYDYDDPICLEKEGENELDR